MHMRNSKAQGVGGIVLRQFRQGEKRLHHPLHLYLLSEPVAALLFCGCDHTAKYTIVNGQVVVENGRVVGVDEEELASKANKISKHLLEMREKNG